jgi:hypothetical protein
MQFIIHEIVVYWDVWVSPANLRFIQRHIGRQLVKKNIIVNTHCFYADDHGWWWGLRQLDLTLDCSKCAFMDPLLVALR